MGLPKPLLMKRIRNDLQMVEEELGLVMPQIMDGAEFPIVIDIHVDGVGGYSSEGQKSFEHDFTISLSDEYPYERPRVRWRSPIFHPNIMSPSEGGLVCVMGLDHWDFDSNLSVFLSDLIDLIKNPNPDNPLRSETCARAAEWFLNAE